MPKINNAASVGLSEQLPLKISYQVMCFEETLLREVLSVMT